jgi:hypothetical protein
VPFLVHMIRRIAFRICISVILPIGRAQAHLAGLFRQTARMEGVSTWTAPVVLVAIVLCWAPTRLVYWVGYRAAVALAGADAGQ